MTLLLGPFHVVLLVLVISGADKLIRPERATEALNTSKLLSRRAGTSPSRAMGLIEISLALIAFTIPSTVTALTVAFVFCMFIWFVRRLRQIDSTAGCGCFGSSTAPPGVTHHVFNAVAAGIAVGAAASMAFASLKPDLQLVATDGLGTLAAYLVTIVVGALLFLNGPTLLAELAAAKVSDTAHRPVQTFSISGAFKP